MENQLDHQVLENNCQRLEALQPDKCRAPYFSSSRRPALSIRGYKKRELRKFVCSRCFSNVPFYNAEVLDDVVNKIDELNLSLPEPELYDRVLSLMNDTQDQFELNNRGFILPASARLRRPDTGDEDPQNVAGGRKRRKQRSRSRKQSSKRSRKSKH
jgi:hypothetical protein